MLIMAKQNGCELWFENEFENCWVELNEPNGRSRAFSFYEALGFHRLILGRMNSSGEDQRAAVSKGF